MTTPIDAHLLRTLFPNASQSTLAANSDAQNTGEDTKLECPPSNGTLAASKGKEALPERIFVRVESVRKRLCDEDNLAEKQIVDCLRYCGAIPNDAPEVVRIATTQRKAAKGEEEHTLIHITYPT